MELDLLDRNPTQTDHAIQGESNTEAATGLKLVAFHLGGEIFAFPLTRVREIIRKPRLSHLPMAPHGLEGLANLRGALLPVMSLPRLLNLPEAPETDATRVIVADLGQTVGFVVERVDRVITVELDRLEPVSNLNTTFATEMVAGIVKQTAGFAMIILLDVEKLIGPEFAGSARKAGLGLRETTGSPDQTTTRQDELHLVSFIVANQEYAFPIDRVQEIIRPPTEISHIPKAASHLIGVINLRDRLIPLVSLRGILQLPPIAAHESHRIAIIASEDDPNQRVGLMVDQIRQVLRVPRDQVDPVPDIYARDGGSREVEAICRLDQGRRLVSILSAERLLEHEVIREATTTHTGDNANAATKTIIADLQFVVFRLDQEEYGVAIQVVQEIIRIPAGLTRLPKTPAFIEGLVNLRGQLLPVVDLRQRLGLPRLERTERQRIIVLVSHGVRTGFIVDAVAHVCKLAANQLEAAPDLSADQQAPIDRIANPDSSGRMILILDTDRLLAPHELNSLRQVAAIKP